MYRLKNRVSFYWLQLLWEGLRPGVLSAGHDTVAPDFKDGRHQSPLVGRKETNKLLQLKTHPFCTIDCSSGFTSIIDER